MSHSSTASAVNSRKVLVLVSLGLVGGIARASSDELGDNLWMWGHDTGHYDGPVNYARHDYKIPWSAPITMPDACLDMGIPNCCVIRPGMPPPADDYLPPYKKLKRISWLLWNSTKEYCLEKAVKIDNIAAFDLDDFFHDEIVEDERPDGTKVKVRKGVMTLKEIDATRKELSEKAGHPVELRMVLYVHQLCPEILPAVEMMDKILLWTWDGSDIKSMRDNILKFRSIAPNTPINVVFEKKDVFLDSTILSMYDDRTTDGAAIDLNGYDQPIRYMQCQRTAGDGKYGHVTSARKAVLKLCDTGTTERQAEYKFTGNAGIHQAGNYVQKLVGVVSTSKGDLTVSSGGFEFAGNAGWSGTNVVVEGGVLILNSPRAFSTAEAKLVVKDTGKLRLHNAVSTLGAYFGEVWLGPTQLEFNKT